MYLSELGKKYNKIIGWGVGDKFLNSYTDNIPITYMVDSNKSKQGTYCKGIVVESPEKILKEEMQKVCIIVFSELYWKDIVMQIGNMEITSDVLLPSMIYPDPLYNELGYKRAFALFAEDAIIKGISQRYGIEIKHYIDIGANHPINGNATILFYLGGATGCLVEPNCDYVASLKASRPMDTVWNLGIAGVSKDGMESQYFQIEGLDTRNTFSAEVADYYKENGFVVQTKLIKLISLNSLLDKYGEKVNYINIDVEGLEYEIIKDFDFNKYEVEFFNIEKGNVLVKELMINHDYELAAETPSNWIFVRAGLIHEKL